MAETDLVCQTVGVYPVDRKAGSSAGLFATADFRNPKFVQFQKPDTTAPSRYIFEEFPLIAC